MEEDDIVENQFFKIKDEEVNNAQTEVVNTQFSNKNLIKYDYSKQHIGPKTFLGKNRKKTIKINAMKDEMCIRETLKQHKICVKDNIAIKLAKVNFKENYETMEEYNAILFPLGCFFEYLGAGFGKINTLTEFNGNVLVINKENNLQKFHMIHLRKMRIEEDTFRQDSLFKDSEECFFSFYLYELHKLNRNAKPRGRQRGEKLLNTFM